MSTSTNPRHRGTTPSPKPVIHHRSSPPEDDPKSQPKAFNGQIIHKLEGRDIDIPYGVSSKRKLLRPHQLNRYHHLIWNFLKHDLGLHTAEREVVFRLLRLYAYYTHIYPKAKQIAAEKGCSVATFWRTVAILEEDGLLTRINRYIIREKAQISNLYLLDKLVLALARMLSEHSKPFTQRWVQHLLEMSGREFWSGIWKWDLSKCRAPP